MNKENNAFASVVMVSKSTYEKNYYERIFLHERLFFNYLRKKNKGWSICDYLNAKKKGNYVLYAMTDISELLIEDIKNNNQELMPSFISDKHADKFVGKYFGCEVKTQEQMIDQYEKGIINKIIITSLLHENEIFIELMNKGIKQEDIISVAEIFFNC